MTPTLLLFALSIVANPNSGAQAPATEPVPVEQSGVYFPPWGAERGLVAKCKMTLDIRPDGETENVCGVCEVSGGDEGEKYASHFVKAAKDALNQWRYAPTPEGFQAYSTNFNFNLAGEAQSAFDALEQPTAPVCLNGKAASQ